MDNKLHPNNVGSLLIQHGYTPEIQSYLERIKLQSDRLQRSIDNIAYEYDIFMENNADGYDYIEELIDEERADQIIDLVQSLVQHLDGHKKPPFIQLKFVWVKEHKCYIECGWYDSNAHSYVLWDREPIEDKSFIRELIWCATVEDNVKIEVLPKPKVAPPNPLFHYHPERYRKSRQFFDRALSIIQNNVSLGFGALTSEESINEVAGLVIEELNAKALSTPLRDRPDHPPQIILNNEITLLVNMAMYQLSGKQIMHINQSLTQMFGHTDVSDIPLNTIKLPYASQYIYFGKQQDIELEEGWFFDGAYVEKYPEDDALRITITASPDIKSEINRWAIKPEPIFHQRIEKADSNIDLMTAITEAYSDKLQEYKTTPDVLDDELPPNVVNVTAKNNIIRAATAERYFEHFNRAIRLIGNACCYLTAHREDREERYPSSAPEKYVTQSNSDKEKQAKRAMSKLESLGYRKVSYYGYLQKSSPAQSEISKKQMHWRRGHWRRQPYGPKNSLRKLVWLMPTIIGFPRTKLEFRVWHITKYFVIQYVNRQSDSQYR